MGGGFKKQKKPEPEPKREESSRPPKRAVEHNNDAGAQDAGNEDPGKPVVAVAQTTAPAAAPKDPGKEEESEEPVESESEDGDPKSTLVNLWVIVSKARDFVSTIVNTNLDGNPEEKQPLKDSYQVLYDSLGVIRDSARLKQWISPLQPYQTGMILVRAEAAVKTMDRLGKQLDAFVSDSTNSTPLKAQAKEAFRAWTADLLAFYNSCEFVTAQQVLDQSNEVARVLRIVLEHTEQPVDSSEDVLDKESLETFCTTCTTETIKLARVANLKGLQLTNPDIQRSLNDNCFTMTRAMRALRIMVKKIVADPSDQQARTNIANIAKGMQAQFTAVEQLAQRTDRKEVVDPMTTEVLSTYYKLYDTAVKDASDALVEFEESPAHDQIISNAVDKIMRSVEVFKKILEQPKPVVHMKATQVMCDAVQHLCSRVHSRLGNEAVLRDQLMQCMYAALHYGIQVTFASCTKVLYHPVIPWEVTTLNGMRGLLSALAVLLKSGAAGGLVQVEAQDAAEALDAPIEQDEMAALIDILHFGRPIPVQTMVAMQEQHQDKAMREQEELLREMAEAVDLPVEQVQLSPRSKASAAADEVNDQAAAEPATATTTATTSTASPSRAGPGPMPDVNVAPFGDLSASVSKGAASSPPPVAKESKQPEAAPQSSPETSPRSKKAKRPAAVDEPDEATKSPRSGDKKGKKKLPPAASSEATGAGKATGPASAAPSASPAKTAAASPAAAAPAAAPAAASGAAAPGSLAAVAAALNLPPLPAGWKPDDVTDDHLPPGYPAPPPKPGVLQKGGTEEEYKKYMVAKFDRNAWEDKLFLYKKKLRDAIAAGAK